MTDRITELEQQVAELTATTERQADLIARFQAGKKSRIGKRHK